MDWLKSQFKSRDQSSKSWDETNGYLFNDVVLPEEVVTLILSFVEIKTLLNCKLVCTKWNDLIKTNHFWRIKLARHNIIPKEKHEWFAYYCYFLGTIFDVNLLKNVNGEQQFQHWNILENGGNQWRVEEIPCGAEPLPQHLEFYGKSSCFTTSYHPCSKVQRISFKNNPVVQKVLDELQPKIYLSEWFAGRFDCGCTYTLGVILYDAKGNLVFTKDVTKTVEQWAGSTWTKVELTCENYGSGVADIEFYHEGADTQFWSGHYGSKMAGGVLKILFEC